MAVTKKKSKRRWVLWVILAIVIVVGWLGVRRVMRLNQNAMNANIKSVSAQAGVLEKTVTGTGNLTAKETLEDVSVPNGIILNDVLVEAGDAVKQGDVLATLDPVALQGAIADAQDELASLDTQLNSIKDKTQSAYITSSISGRIKEILAAEGDTIDSVMTQKGALIILSIDGKMKVSFVPSNTANLAQGDEVVVTLSDGSKEDGKIESVSAQQCVVTLTDDGPAVGDMVTVALADGTVLGKGPLEINKPIAVTGTSGTVKDVLKALNDTVNKGTKLIELKEAAPSRDYEQLYSDRLDKAETLNTLLVYAQGNAITAPDDGVIETVAVGDGDSVGTESSSSDTSALTGMASSKTSTASTTTTASEDETVAFTIKTQSTLSLKAAMDELDILSLSVGQSAKVTLDALPNDTFEGTITEISDTGLVSQGVTTYDVTIAFASPSASMKEGMNATATIVVQHKDNVVKIPLEALQVWAMSSSSMWAQREAPLSWARRGLLPLASPTASTWKSPKGLRAANGSTLSIRVVLKMN
jgi:multidrug efflux pump subunit AcrA (membrane-fusion protein)